MQKFFENKLAFAAILLLFALAMVCNATIGASRSKTNDLGMNSARDARAGAVEGIIVQKGPNVPTDPWDWNKVQKGPNVPTDPWDWRAAHIATAEVRKGPNVPTDPWDWNKVQKGPNVPTDPWDWAKAV